jgi:hypothetical protein
MPWVNREGRGLRYGSHGTVTVNTPPSAVGSAQLVRLNADGWHWVHSNPELVGAHPDVRRAYYQRGWAAAETEYRRELATLRGLTAEGPNDLRSRIVQVANQADRQTRRSLPGADSPPDRTERTNLAMAVRYGFPVWVNREGVIHPLSVPEPALATERAFRREGWLPIRPASESMDRSSLAAAWRREAGAEEARRAERARREELDALVDTAHPSRGQARAGPPPSTRASHAESGSRSAQAAREPGDADDDTGPQDRVAAPNVAGGESGSPVWRPGDRSGREDFALAVALTFLDEAWRALPRPVDVPQHQLAEFALLQFELAGLFRHVYTHLARSS